MEENLSQRLVKARSGHGWSQADLAEVSGVAAAQISRYEASRSKPRAEVVAKLAKALAVRFEWLAYGQGNIELEDGGEVPLHPTSRVVLANIDLDDELIADMEAIAESEGITYEMAFNVVLREGLALMKADPHAFLERIKSQDDKPASES